MELPAHILERLPPELRRNSLLRAADSLSDETTRAAWRNGSPKAPLSPSNPLIEWPQRLLQGDLPRGGVVELALSGGCSGGGTGVALRTCVKAQQEGRQLRGQADLCAFVDPGRSLHAPGLLAAGVELDRLLVVRPSIENLSRVTLKLAESGLFSVICVDTIGASSAPLDLPLAAWVRIVRRLTLALEGSDRTLLLLTDKSAPRPIPLPVAQRLDLTRVSLSELELEVKRDLSTARQLKVRFSMAPNRGPMLTRTHPSKSLSQKNREHRVA